MIVGTGTTTTKIWGGKTHMENKCKDYNCVRWTPWEYSCAVCAMTNALIEAELRQDEFIEEESKDDQ